MREKTEKIIKLYIQVDNRNKTNKKIVKSFLSLYECFLSLYESTLPTIKI